DLDDAAKQPRELSWHDYLKDIWNVRIYSQGNFAARTFEQFWIGAVREGVLDVVGENARTSSHSEPTLALSSVTAAMSSPTSSTGRALVIQPTIAHGDGVSMANPQMLELPDPVSKVCWDNFASIAP